MVREKRGCQPKCLSQLCRRKPGDWVSWRSIKRSVLRMVELSSVLNIIVIGKITKMRTKN